MAVLKLAKISKNKKLVSLKPVFCFTHNITILDPRDFVPFPTQKQALCVPILAQKHPDKTHLRETIRLMRQDGMSYRENGKQLGIHWTRVRQIVNTKLQESQ